MDQPLPRRPRPPPPRPRRRAPPTSPPPRSSRPPPTPPLRARPKNRRRRPAPPPPPQVNLKVTIRRLPPTLSATEFATAAAPHGADAALWSAYAPGSSAAQGSIKHSRTLIRHSVAYLGFATVAEAARFGESFDGFRFAEQASSKGGLSPEYIARVERAVWQATPPLRRRAPVSHGSIEQDPDFIAFVQELEADGRREGARAPGASVGGGTAILASGGEGRKEGRGKARVTAVTPLMEDVRERRREREQKKKVAKASPRGRTRRQVVGDQAKVLADGKGSRVTGRKKKRGVEASAKRADDTEPGSRKESAAKPPMGAGRRGSRRDDKAHSGNGAPVAGRKGIAGSAGDLRAGLEVNGLAEERPSGGRSGSGRSRSGRSRAKGRGVDSLAGVPSASSAGSTSNVVVGGDDGANLSLRLLRKEASNGSKT